MDATSCGGWWRRGDIQLAMALPDLVFVGGYTTEMGGGAAGIATYVPEQVSPTQVRLKALEPVELISPSYLVPHPTQPWLFAVSEAAPALVSSLRIEESGALTPLTTTPSGSDGACHLAVSPDGSFVVVAHYSRGAVSSFPIHGDGTLGPRADLLELAGSGPDRERQDQSHAHQVVFDVAAVPDRLLVPDLGADVVWQLRLDGDGRLTQAADPVRAPAGAGPRHLVVLDDLLICVLELSGEVAVAGRRAGGSFADLSSVGPSSTADGADRAYPSAVRAAGTVVYVANRGPGTVTAFDADPATGSVRRASEFGCGGPWPRDLVIEGGRLWVANQSTDEVCVLADPAGTGNWRPELVLGSPSPAAIVLSARPGVR